MNLASAQALSRKAHSPVKPNEICGAAYEGSVERVRQLLDSGISVDAAADNSLTVLMHASKGGQVDCALLLLERGAKVCHVQDADGKTALHWASSCDSVVMAELLIQHGADIEATDTEASTALMHAAANGNSEVAAVLLSHGANANAEKPGSDRITALKWASRDGHMDAVAVLMPWCLLQLAQPLESLNGTTLHSMIAAACQLDEETFGLAVARAVFDSSSFEDAMLSLFLITHTVQKRYKAVRLGNPAVGDECYTLSTRLQLAACALVEHVDNKANEGKKRSEQKVALLLRTPQGLEAMALAVRTEAKAFMMQALVQRYVKLQWRGEAGRGPRAWIRGQGAPLTKFVLASSFDLALALLFTSLSPVTIAAPYGANLLILWFVSGLVWEFRQIAMTRRCTDYFAERFNRIEIPLAISGIATLLSALLNDGRLLADYIGDNIGDLDSGDIGSNRSFGATLLLAVEGEADVSEATRILRSFTCLLLWLRIGRVLLVSSTFGPFVLMVFRMLFGDVLQFLVILGVVLFSCASAAYSLNAPADASTGEYSWSAVNKCTSAFETFSGALLFTFESSLTGADFFECSRGSDSPIPRYLLAVLSYALAGLLLLNMLIAMMAKTFDNVGEASSMNFNFLFAQIVMSTHEQPLLPPPLYLLAIPWDVAHACKWVVKRCGSQPSSWVDTPNAQTAARKSSAATVGFAKEHASAAKEEEVRLLAREVTSYIELNQEDVAAETRWRTLLKKQLAKQARAQAQETKAIGERLAQVQTQVQEMQTTLAAVADHFQVQVRNDQTPADALSLEVQRRTGSLLGGGPLAQRVTMGLTKAPMSLASNPMNLTSAPLNIAGNPLDIASNPLDIAGAPLDIASNPMNIASNPMNIAGAPMGLMGAPFLQKAPDEARDVWRPMTPGGGKKEGGDNGLAKASSGERAKAPGGERAKAPGGERAKAPSGERAKAPGGERAKAPSGERAKAPSGERAKAPSGDQEGHIVKPIPVRPL